MYTVSPRQLDRFHLRLLLLNRVNMKSFVDLRTVDDVTYNTFGEAARALHLLHDDAHYSACLEEAAQFGMPRELRSIFSYMLAFCEIVNPQVMFDRFVAAMSEDHIYQGLSPPQAAACEQLYSQLNHDQRAATDEILEIRAILTPRNIDVHAMNDKALDLIPGTTRIYRSIDELMSDDAAQTDFTTEFLNSLGPASLPPHALKLKEGVIAMLLRNLDVGRALCNGTRLIVCDLDRFVLRCRWAVGPRKWEAVVIPRIAAYAERGLPFRFRRRQFPLCFAFAMTINKAQGQSLSHVGIYLPQDVFSHGQLYVALSRAKSRDGVKVLSKNSRVKNIVMRSIL
ncbi:hypothetical protein Q1695_000524 [Nippostrongylus brasiliensis]|nr:hypothetical protein Q1695_000524 [Nippostrongylus brasiliensis]